jgi:hypothetical protein
MKLLSFPRNGWLTLYGAFSPPVPTDFPATTDDGRPGDPPKAAAP